MKIASSSSGTFRPAVRESSRLTACGLHCTDPSGRFLLEPHAMLTLQCEFCGQSFRAYPSASINGKGRYCCRAHYSASRKNWGGRFLTKFRIDAESGCWFWEATIDRHGYGLVWNGTKQAFAHRRSYELVVGKIPDGLCVCHSCDEPSCVNPEHLWVGTQADNMHDMAEKGRWKWRVMQERSRKDD